MSSSYGGSGQGSPPSGQGPGEYDQGGYDPGAAQGIPPVSPVAGTQGYPQGGYPEGTAGAGYSEGNYATGGYPQGAAQGGATAASYDTAYTQGTESRGASAAPTGRPDVGDESVGSLVGRLTGDLSKLMRQELELAKAEVGEEAKKAGKAVGLLGGAALAGLMTAVFVSITLMWLLDKPLDVWLAALIVTLLWAILGAVLFMIGKKKLAEVNPKPEQTIETLKEDKQWVQAQKS